MTPRPTNSRVIIRRNGDGKHALLDSAIDDSGFFVRLESARAARGKVAADFKVVIKPSFMFMYSKADHSTFTDPELVEHLIDRLVARGFTNVTLAYAARAATSARDGRAPRRRRQSRPTAALIRACPRATTRRELTNDAQNRVIA